MDQKLIKPDAANKEVEVCDIYSKKNQFIHVKNYTSSATLSHLFSQGRISAQSFLEDAGFRQRFQARVNKDKATQFPHLQFANEVVASNFEIVYAIACDQRSVLHDRLPFFSLLNLMQSTKTLKLFRKISA